MLRRHSEEFKETENGLQSSPVEQDRISNFLLFYMKWIFGVMFKKKRQLLLQNYSVHIYYSFNVGQVAHALRFSTALSAKQLVENLWLGIMNVKYVVKCLIHSRYSITNRCLIIIIMIIVIIMKIHLKLKTDFEFRAKTITNSSHC